MDSPVSRRCCSAPSASYESVPNMSATHPHTPITNEKTTAQPFRARGSRRRSRRAAGCRPAASERGRLRLVRRVRALRPPGDVRESCRSESRGSCKKEARSGANLQDKSDSSRSQQTRALNEEMERGRAGTILALQSEAARDGHFFVWNARVEATEVVGTAGLVWKRCIHSIWKPQRPHDRTGSWVWRANTASPIPGRPLAASEQSKSRWC